MDRLEQRLDDAEADRRGEHANWQAARDRLLSLVEALAAAGARTQAQDPQPDEPPLEIPQPQLVEPPIEVVTALEATGPSFGRWFAALVRRRRADRASKG